MIKRAFDLVAATIGLVVLSPVMAVIAVLIKRDSEGPVIFRQERVGRGGSLFTLLKFRTMVTDTQSAGPLVTAATDPRITRFGAHLRSTKLDELPQLVNVILGDMSLVGPRPEVPRYVALWTEDDRQAILSMQPGITDPATLQLRREESLLARQPDPERFYAQYLLPRKTAIYREYVQQQSLRLDLRLVLATIASLVGD